MAQFDLGEHQIVVSGVVWQGSITYSDLTERLRFVTTVPFAGQVGDDTIWTMERVAAAALDELGIKSVAQSGSQLGFYYSADQNQVQLMFSGHTPAREYGRWEIGLFGG